MFDEVDRNPYIHLVQADFQREEGSLQVFLGDESVTRRMWEYEQNDLKRYLARWNPLGSEEKFMEDRGEVFGEPLYISYDDFLDEEDEVLIYRERGVKSVDADPGAASRQTLYSLGNGADRDFYLAALETVEELGFTESVAARSEI